MLRAFKKVEWAGGFQVQVPAIERQRFRIGMAKERNDVKPPIATYLSQRDPLATM
jgi:hypothetical protein